MKQLEFDIMLSENSDLGCEDGKTCSKCKQFLPLDRFNFASGGNYLRAECRECNNEMQKVRKSLRAKHGMPSEGYKCPICNGTEESVKGTGNTRNGSWVLDHCHDTGRFRGWLCHKCNHALGGFNDDSQTLWRAINYLKELN